MHADNTDLTVVRLAAFTDNYIWVLRRGADAVVVDPGDAAPVLRYLNDTATRLAGILVTHHHADHVGGIAALLRNAPHTVPIAVFAPGSENIAQCTVPVSDGERITLPALGDEMTVIAVPGHTAGHVAYYGANPTGDGVLFCGDTLFAAGCGRLFEGSAAQMLASLDRLAALPERTLAYCAHEYTQANLRFARAVEPDNTAIAARASEVAAARARGEATVPTRLVHEHATNPFLRCAVATVAEAASAHAGQSLHERVAIFAALRRWKDEFR